MNDIIYAGKHALTFNVSNHIHKTFELIYCTGGSGHISFNGTTLEYSKGNTAVIPPMIPHTNSSDEGFTNIFLNIENFSVNVSDPVIISGDENGFLANAFQAAYYYFSSESSQHSDFLSLYGSLIAAHVSQNIISIDTNSIAEKIERHIIDNYSDSGYDLGGYLRSLPFSYDYLIKLFKKTYGCTPHKYLTGKRLQASAALLMLSQKSDIAETARLTGFSDPLYFSRLFKKYYGVSPRAYKAGTGEKSSNESPDSMKIFLN